MEILARKLAREIARSLSYDNEKEQVVAYGLIAIIQTAVTILLVLLFGFAVGAPVEAMILCFSVSLLRRYSGGAHAEYIELCTALSVIYCTLFSYLSRYVIGPSIQLYYLIGIAILFYAMAFYIVYRRAPVDSPNKPIRTEAKKRRMREGSFLTLSVYLAVSAVFFGFGLKNDVFTSLQISLLFGVAWQIFTLTKAGAGFLSRVNRMYKKILPKKKGGVST